MNTVVSISGNQQFILGELEEDIFKVSLKNLSKESVDILIVEKFTDNILNRIKLKSGNNIEVTVLSDQKAILKNNSSNLVRIESRLNKGVEGMYYEPIKSDQKLLRKDSLINDIELYKLSLESLHPGLYRYNNKKDIDSLFLQFRNNIPSEIYEGDFFLELSRLTSKLKCGHTYLNPWNMQSDLRERLFLGKKYLPLGIRILDGKFFAVENVSENTGIKSGAEILEINGIKADELYSNMMSLSKRDGNNINSINHYLSLDNFQSSQWEAFDMFLSLLDTYRNGEYEIIYQNYLSESSNKCILKALDKEEREAKIAQKYGKDYLDNKRWDLEILNEDLAIMKIGTFAIWEKKNFDYKIWLSDCFSRLEKSKVENLIIDIRGNGGGLTDPANHLISYLISEDLICNKQKKVLIKTVKYNEEILPYITPKIDFLVNGLPDEYYKKYSRELYELLYDGNCIDTKPQLKAFKGKVFIFGNGTNVSATYTLLDKAKEFNFGKYIGDVSGGNLQGINGGEYAFFEMPYSKMEIDIPLKYFYPGVMNTDSGVIPDVEIKYTQKDLANNDDPYLNYVLDNLKD
ncbi:MAG: S41 family peptidase [Winogradskyella sp.]